MIQHFIIIIQLKERHTSGSFTMDSFNLDPEEAEQHLEKQLKHILGDKYEEETNNFIDKMEDVNKMLQDLVSKDKEKVFQILLIPKPTFFFCFAV